MSGPMNRDYPVISLWIMLAAVATMVASAATVFRGCQTAKCGAAAESGCVNDTVTYTDTIPFYEPKTACHVPIGYKYITLPRFNGGRTVDTVAGLSDNPPVDTMAALIEDDGDSVTLRLPMTQTVYEGYSGESGKQVAAYKAYVSGVYPRLDSIFVYPRRDVVITEKPTKRWHIGPTIGYGVTHGGFQPYIGISVTYSLISW